MAYHIPNSFSTYKLTAEEETIGTMLSPEQTYVLQNKIAEISEQILALEFDVTLPMKFTQDEAFLKGQLSFARFMLDSSNSLRAALNNPSQE